MYVHTEFPSPRLFCRHAFKVGTGESSQKRRVSLVSVLTCACSQDRLLILYEFCVGMLHWFGLCTYCLVLGYIRAPPIVVHDVSLAAITEFEACFEKLVYEHDISVFYICVIAAQSVRQLDNVTLMCVFALTCVYLPDLYMFVYSPLDVCICLTFTCVYLP
jgi:hypothetical protein